MSRLSVVSVIILRVEIISVNGYDRIHLYNNKQMVEESYKVYVVTLHH